MTIGFLGLGIMGKPMAKSRLGAHQGGTPKPIAEQVDLVITMLPSSSHVTGAALGEEGFIERTDRALTAAVMEGRTALKVDGHEGEGHSGLVQHYETVARTHLGRSGS